MKKIYILFVVIVLIFVSIGSYYGYSQYITVKNQLSDARNRAHFQTEQLQKSEALNHEYKITIEDLTYDLQISKLKNDAYESAIYETFPDISEEEIDMIAKTVLGEAGCCSTYEQSMVAWCILNRLDTGRWGNRVAGVVMAPYQFHGYVISYPVEPEIRALVIDVIYRWQLEKTCGWDVGRTLPADMINFHANKEGTHNLFYNNKGEYYSWEGKYNPYAN